MVDMSTSQCVHIALLSRRGEDPAAGCAGERFRGDMLRKFVRMLLVKSGLLEKLLLNGNERQGIEAVRLHLQRRKEHVRRCDDALEDCIQRALEEHFDKWSN